MDEQMESLEMATAAAESEPGEKSVRTEDADLPEMLYAEDAAPRRDLRAVIRGESGNGLTDTDRATLKRFRELAADTPQAIEGMLRDEKLPAMARIRLIELILERAYGKAEATVNVNGAVAGIEASEMRVEALVRSLKATEQN